MPLITAPAEIVRAAITRAVELNLSAGSVTRALNRANFSTRGLGVAARFRQASAAQAARATISALRGNAKPRLGRGMIAQPLESLTRYSYRGVVTFRTSTGELIPSYQTVMSNVLLTKTQAGRALMEQARQYQYLGRTGRSGVSEAGATPIRGELVEAIANVV